MLTPTACRAEIAGLHEFFVEWFTGRADGPSPSRLEDALAPEFEMVTPTGERVDREALADGIAESHGRHAGESFDIDGTDHARYFQQAHNGVPVRMALLDILLGGDR